MENCKETGPGAVEENDHTICNEACRIIKGTIERQFSSCTVKILFRKGRMQSFTRERQSPKYWAFHRVHTEKELVYHIRQVGFCNGCIEKRIWFLQAFLS